MLNATEDAVFFMDTQGKVIFVNETLARWLHTPKERLLNTNIFDAIPEPWRTARKAHADKAVLTGEAQRFEDEREGRWLEHRVFPIKGPDNTVSHLALYAVDITERRRMEDLALAQRDLAMNLTEMTQLDQAVKLCLDTALSLVDMDGGGVYLLEEKSGALHLVSWRGLSGEFVEATRSYTPDSPNAKLVQLGEPVYKTHATFEFAA